MQLIFVYCLYPTTLLNSLISSNRFLVESLGFSINNIMLSANIDHFTISFPIWMIFISFSCLIALVGTSRLHSIKMVRVGIFILFLILRKSFHLSTIECDVNCGLVIYVLYYVEVPAFYIYFLESLIMHRC